MRYVHRQVADIVKEVSGANEILSLSYPMGIVRCHHIPPLSLMPTPFDESRKLVPIEIRCRTVELKNYRAKDIVRTHFYMGVCTCGKAYYYCEQETLIFEVKLKRWGGKYNGLYSKNKSLFKI